LKSIDASSSAEVILDNKGVVSIVNDEWQALTRHSEGIASKVTVGSQYQLMATNLASQCPTLGADLCAKISNTLAGTKQAFIVEYPSVQEDGVFWYQLTGQAFISGQARAIRLTNRDITTQRYSDVNARFLSRAIDISRVGVTISDAVATDMPLICVNKAFEKISGYSATEVAGKNCRMLQGDRKLQEGLQNVRMGIASASNTVSMIQNFRKDGSLFLNELSIFPVRNELGQVLYFVGVQRDLTTEQIAKESLFDIRARERIGLRFANVGVFELNTATGNIESQDYAHELLGLDSSTELTVDLLLAHIAPEDRDRFDESLKSCLGGISGIDLEYRVVWPDGSIKWLHTKGHVFEQCDTNGLRLVCMSQDVTQRRIVDRHIRYVAEHDALTGLPNRAVMRDRCEQVLAVARRNQTCVGLLFIDLDDFKEVNDTHGHQVGDELLKQVANRLRSAVRESDTVCRQSGDEFVVILHDLPNNTAVEHCVKKICDALTEPYEIGEVSLLNTASIGIACSPADGLSTDELVRHADMAMYAAKRKGGGHFEYYSQAIGKTIQDIQSLRSELGNAIADGELTLFFQPQVHAASGKMVGLEALLRWLHPKRGLLAPEEFLPVAQSSGDLLFALEEWVIYEAMRQRLAWTVNGQFLNVPVYVNVSPTYFSDRHLLSKLSAHLRSVNLGPMNFGLEVPESAIWGHGIDANQSIATLRDLDSLGISLTIDNFGAGTSNIGHLASCPVDCLKIDKGAMKNLTEERSALAALGAISALGKILHFQVIAQAIETKQQARVASRLGCTTLQGNLICSPVSARELVKYAGNNPAIPMVAY
jgi:diguanylate cyclase (GGDEF)-like protein/PAS domain S-box-containing protein